MTAATSADAAIFNERKIVELRTLLGDQKASEFVARFRADLHAKLEQLAELRQSPHDVAEVAHKLVAVAGTLGFDALSQSCQILRSAARDASSAQDFSGQYSAVENAARQALQHVC